MSLFELYDFCLTLSVTVGRSASHLKKFSCSSIIIVYSQLQTIFVKPRHAYAHTCTHKGASFFIRTCYRRKAEGNGRKTERNGYIFLSIHGRISGHPPPPHTHTYTHKDRGIKYFLKTNCDIILETYLPHNTHGHPHTHTIHIHHAYTHTHTRKRMDTNVIC